MGGSLASCIAACCNFICGVTRPVYHYVDQQADPTPSPRYHTSADPDRHGHRRRFLITAPHTTPPTSGYDPALHLIDTEAWQNAQTLHSLLPDSYLVPKPPFTRSSTLDPNRKDSKHTEWRVSLASLIQSRKFDGLIDVHGFPGNELHEDFYFIAHQPERPVHTRIVEHVYALTRARGIVTASPRAKPGLDNSITDDALEFFDLVFLIEICEGLSHEKILLILKCLCEAINHFQLV